MGVFLSGWLPVALSQGFVDGFCCFIITVTALHVFYLIVKFRRVSKDMAAIKKHAERIEREGILHYNIEEETGKRSAVAEVWALYARQLIRQDADVGLRNKSYFSAQSAQEFFNEESYVEAVINMAAVRAVPSALTGLGILGTFLGLAAGIQSADQFTREGLMPLLNGAGLAFYTSIFGLFFSLIVTMLNKVVVHRLINCTMSAANQLDDAFPVMNRKDFDYQSLKLLQHCATAIQCIENGFNDHHKVLDQRIETLLRSLVTEFTDRLATEMNSMGRDFNAAVEGSAKQMQQSTENFSLSVDQVRQCLTESIESIRSAVQASVDDLNDAKTTMHVELVALTERVASTSKEVIEENRKSLEAIEKISATLTETADQFEGRNEAWLKEANKSLVDVTQSLTDHFTAESAKFASTVGNECTKLTAGVQALLADVRATQTGLFEDARQAALKTTQDLAGEFRKQTATLATDYVDELTKFSDRLEKSALAVEAANNNLATKLVERITDASERIAQRYEEVGRLSAELEATLRKLAEAEAQGRTELDEKLSAVENVAVALESVKDIVKPIAQSASALQQVEGILNRAAAANESAGRSMAQASSEMKGYLDRIRESVGTTIDEADLKLANIVKLLNKTVSTWNDDQSRNAKQLLEAADAIRRGKEDAPHGRF